MFSPTLLSLLLLLPYYYCHYCCYYYWLLLLLLFPQELCVTGAWAGMAGGARGWVVGRAGFWGAFATWVWGQQLQPPDSWPPNLHMRRRR